MIKKLSARTKTRLPINRIGGTPGEGEPASFHQGVVVLGALASLPAYCKFRLRLAGNRVIGQWDDNGISATDAEKARLVYGKRTSSVAPNGKDKPLRKEVLAK